MKIALTILSLSLLLSCRATPDPSTTSEAQKIEIVDWYSCFDKQTGMHITLSKIIGQYLKDSGSYKHKQTSYSTGRFPRIIIVDLQRKDPLKMVTVTAIAHRDCSVDTIYIR